MDSITSTVYSAEKIDPFAARDVSEPARRQAFVTLIVAHIMLLILGMLTFSQLAGEHKGKTQPVDYPGNRGGWESGNDTARVVICVFGTLILMIADVIVNDPSNFPARFSKSYREAITAVGFTIGFVSLASFACAYIDTVAVAAYTGCNSCDRSDYLATCFFDVFSAIALFAASICVLLFGRATPLKLADEDLATQELLKDTAKLHPELQLPTDIQAVVAVHAPCCGTLVAISDLAAHRAECDERARLVADARAAEKEARRQARLALKKESQPATEVELTISESDALIDA